jgi:hypothetical protein
MVAYHPTHGVTSHNTEPFMFITVRISNPAQTQFTAIYVYTSIFSQYRVTIDGLSIDDRIYWTL